ncbi:MAG: PEP-CTERM sorting domain-containing protein, partial [Deltaproteobacteria bacterium]|nr:PEP-CTERM sorting domain-containing protein [Deltaproteobacteria bacterium]
DVAISGSDPQNWFSLWVYGEAGVEVAPVPDPGTMLLLGSGLIGLAGFRRKFRKG